ncbi:MAG: hypothetical protein M1812_001594 [Candelaria pacifica]|nr:MAG: hypothetical protein M1812_001594 [Candelaria pacifica]
MAGNPSGVVRILDEDQPQRADTEYPALKATVAIMGSEDQPLPTSSAGNDATALKAQAKVEDSTLDDDVKNKISRLLKGKEREWTSVREKEGPLRLLDMPTEILYGIIKEVTHTNDLTSLARTCSALHNLTVPQIYSRFDIVWPDTHATADPRTGVDALTYGLATLVMGEEIFKGSTSQKVTMANRPSSSLGLHDGNIPSSVDEQGTLTDPASAALSPKRRRGNNFARYTRKFSLGNGPPDWVAEYMITKEGGKMLGTLVALAVARMPKLEVFVWDMPTGVLRDVWLALSSLADGRERQDCHLERIWIRWHDNSDSVGGSIPVNSTAIPPPPPVPGSLVTTNVGILLPSSGTATTQAPLGVPSPESGAQSAIVDRVEYPTFSVLPPLKSLSVLDIDELLYLDEMSILIARSQQSLRELRVGIARQALHRDWTMTWDGPGIQQVDHKVSATIDSAIGDKRLGGVLGVLVGRVYDIHKKHPSTSASGKGKASAGPSITNSHVGVGATAAAETSLLDIDPSLDQSFVSPDGKAPSPNETLQPSSPIHIHSASGIVNTSQSDPLQSPTTSPQLDHTGPPTNELPDGPLISIATPPTASSQDFAANASVAQLAEKLPKMATEDIAASREGVFTGRKPLNGKLRLETLELERVQLSVSVVQRALDWSLLTNITLLRCENHEQLWKALRKSYAPRPSHTSIAAFSRSNDSTGQHVGGSNKSRTRSLAPIDCEYQLNLKKVHTDAVSPALISFLKDTLAPNSLEVLFLKDNTAHLSTVTLKEIHRGPLRRHRASLRKLMVDSCERLLSTDQPAPSARGRRWMFNREVLAFVTSGKMCSLRELGLVLEYKDWHYFLQRLPLIPHLRSLYIPYLADHVHAANLDVALDPRELALQIVDIVALRPEVEICYMGILSKCFEILEKKPIDERHGAHEGGSSPAHAGPGGVMTDGAGEEEDEDDDDEMDEEEMDDDDDDADADADPSDSDETASEPKDDSEDDDSFVDEDEKSRVMPRLREILFYDDKVAIFKARHGRL